MKSMSGCDVTVRPYPYKMQCEYYQTRQPPSVDEGEALAILFDRLAPKSNILFETVFLLKPW